MNKNEMILSILQYALDDFSSFEISTDFKIYHEDLIKLKKYYTYKKELKTIIKELV